MCVYVCVLSMSRSYRTSLPKGFSFVGRMSCLACGLLLEIKGGAQSSVGPSLRRECPVLNLSAHFLNRLATVETGSWKSGFWKDLKIEMQMFEYFAKEKKKKLD